MLDAGHNSFSELVIDQASIEVSPGGAARQWDSTRDSEDWGADEPGLPSEILDAAEHPRPGDDRDEEWREVRPDLDLDKIVPLLDVALDTADFEVPADVAESEVALAEQSVEYPDRRDAGPSAAELIHEAGRQLPIESQAAQRGPHTAPTADVQELLHRHVEFDIVLPEGDDGDASGASPVLETDAEHQTPPARHYRRMFSELRRRQQR
jgi:hypothetical protein